MQKKKPQLHWSGGWGMHTTQVRTVNGYTFLHCQHCHQHWCGVSNHPLHTGHCNQSLLTIGFPLPSSASPISSSALRFSAILRLRGNKPEEYQPSDWTTKDCTWEISRRRCNLTVHDAIVIWQNGEFWWYDMTILYDAINPACHSCMAFLHVDHVLRLQASVEIQKTQTLLIRVGEWLKYIGRSFTSFVIHHDVLACN